MVNYTTFTSIAFEVAEEKGGQFAGIEDGGAFMSELGDLWTANKQSYVQMTEEQLRRELMQVIEA